MLHHLETVYVASDSNLIDVRFPVQYVIRPVRKDRPDYRGYAGQIAAGRMRPGDEVIVLPSGITSTIKSIDSSDGPLDEEPPELLSAAEPPDELAEEPPEFDSSSRGRRPESCSAESPDTEPVPCEASVGAFSDRWSESAATGATAALWKPAGDEREPVDGEVCATETRAWPSCSVIEQP